MMKMMKEEDEAARRQTWEKEETEGMEGFAVVFMSEVYK